MKKIFFLLLFMASLGMTQNLSLNPWKDIAHNNLPVGLEKQITVDTYRLIELDKQLLAEFLKTAPAEFSYTSGRVPILELPLPNGKTSKFAIYYSPVMESELAAKFPEIRTYLAKSIDDNSYSARLDLTPHGFHGQIFTSEGTVFIDPYSKGNSVVYLSYFKKDFKPSAEKLEKGICLVDEQTPGVSTEARLAAGTLRTYRLACAATGEYTTFHGGTVALAMAAIVTSINRINQVYEREFSIRMLLVANNNLLVYTNASTDPYTNNNGSTMLGQNINNCNTVIGSANYDIGHVFSTGGGGVAYLGSVCGSSKAGGVTGGPAPVGDPFDIDYVAHEMGHQYGANHTQNNNCQRNANTAFEPGSAATIMGYAGICSPNLQNNSDDYFHIGSMVEISNFIAGSGNNCAVSVSNGNEKPVITSFPTGGFTIPINTPFKLTGAATDVDNTSITYCWEEYDLGPSTHPNTPSGNAPIFRSFDPEISGTRWFPKRANVFAGTQVLGEILPSYARNLKFRLVVRDNNPGAGDYVFSEITFAVAGSSPFKVTYPNTNVSIPALSSVNITWDVANTNVAPVNCQTVNVKLTTDGGNTFVTVANALPNTGAATITMPDVQTTTARLYIEAADNIFYDVSDVNFTVSQAVPVELASFSAVSNNGTIKLEWTTATETNNKGFFIERSLDGNEFLTTGFVEGKGTTTRFSEYVFSEKLTQSGNYTYRLKQVDYDGSSSFSNEVEVELANPATFSLDQNYPNPFNPSTSISFSLPEASSVKIVVYDVLGNKITELLNGNLALGYHKLNFDAGKLNSGLYLYTITAQSNSGQSFSTTRKMMLLK